MKRAAVILITILIITMAIGCQNTANRPLSQDQNQNNNTQSVNNNQAMADKFENLAEQVSGVQRAYVAISSTDMNNNGTGNTANNNPNTNMTNNTTPYGRGVINTEPLGNDGLNYNSYGDLYNGRNTNNPSSATDINNMNNMVVMVGIKLDNETNTANMSDIERRVESKIMNADNRVNRVLVTADAGMIEQINDINTSIKNGTPVETVQRSINNLTGRLMTNR